VSDGAILAALNGPKKAARSGSRRWRYIIRCSITRKRRAKSRAFCARADQQSRALRRVDRRRKSHAPCDRYRGRKMKSSNEFAREKNRMAVRSTSNGALSR